MVVPRAIAQDVELHGVQLKAGDSVQLVLGSANDDEAEFGPSEVDFSRDPNRHLAFGGSHHLCLGAHLARSSYSRARRVPPAHPRLPDRRRRGDPLLTRHPPGGASPDHLPGPCRRLTAPTRSNACGPCRADT